MIAYCGLNCLECEGYLATQSGDQEELKKVAEKWSEMYQSDVKPEFVICDGCKAEGRHSYYCGNMCKIRQCCIEKTFGSCIECADFPCEDEKLVLEHAPQAKANLEKLRP